MSEEEKQENHDEHEYSEIEQEAMSQGWRPDREKLEAEGKEYVSAEEYLIRGKYIKDLKRQGSEIQQLRTTINQINEHNRRVAENDRKKLEKDYNERIARLEQEKLQALEDGEHRRVVEIDRELREAPPTIENAPQNNEFDSEYATFKSDNAWYETDTELRQYADTYGMGMMQTNPNLTPKQLFDNIIKEVKQRYPDKFENPNRKKASNVDSGTTPKPKKKGGVSVDDLTTDEKVVYQNFERMKVFKSDEERQQYLKEVVELRA